MKAFKIILGLLCLGWAAAYVPSFLRAWQAGPSAYHYGQIGGSLAGFFLALAIAVAFFNSAGKPLIHKGVPKASRASWAPLWVGLLLAVVVLGGIAFFTPLNQVVYDPPPEAAEMAETVVLDKPLPPLPAESKPNSAIPLGRELVIRESVPATVPRGAVLLPPGMPVELQKDNGETVEIKFGERKQAAVVTVPRSAVANRGEMPPLPPAMGPLESVRHTVVDLGHAPASSIAVEAKEIGTGRGISRSFDDWVGSTDHNYHRSKGLEVRVRNLSRRPTGDFEISIYWTGRRLADNKLHITHGETFKTNVDGVSEHSETSWCPLLDSTVTTYDWTNTKRTSGSKFDGWFVVVTRDQQMLVGRGATETYNNLIKDNAQLQPLLATWSATGKHATDSRPDWRQQRPGESAIPQDKTTRRPYY